MATSIITKFVLGQFAKRSAKKTGIATLKKASDSIVQSNVKNIEIILKNMGVDPKNLKSTDDVLKHMNIHKAMVDQHLKQEFKGLGLGQGIKSLEKKKPFEGFTPKIVPKDKTLLKESPEAIAKIKAENKAAAERLRKKKLDEEPDDLASGGIAGQLHLNRPGYQSGLLVKLAKLLKGKKKNVWRGFETDYKNVLRGSMYPEEFSGRFFTPDKDLAKWYAMRQGTLTGKVKKLKLTEKEIKAAQEFAEKNLDIQYGDDLLVSEELAKKAKVDLPATALAKIEAVIRKAKHTKKAKKHGQTDWAEGGRASYTKGGLAHVLGV